MIDAQTVHAISDFQSGHNHGCDDADKQPNERYFESAMKVIILSAIAICLLMGTPLSYAAQKPYWSATPVNSPGFKQVHLIITQININQSFDTGKTKVSLSMYDNHTRHDVDLVKHIVDISKHVRPTDLNTTLDVGYFIVPVSLIESEGNNLTVGIHVLGKDGTVVQPLNDTVYMGLDDYFITI